MQVVICGGGVIGACTAYFLGRRGVDVTVVERAEVAAAASGKAGGFLALDWCAGTLLDALARRSFALHERLAAELNGDWGHRPMSAYAGTVTPARATRRPLDSKFEWLADAVTITSKIGMLATTAIVHPRKFTRGMMRAAEMHGAKVRSGPVTGLVRSTDVSAVRGVEIDGEVLDADAVVIAMGPWSILAAQWLRLPVVYGHKSPSLVYDTGSEVPAQALFLDYRDEDGEVPGVEVFPRADGSTHVAGISEDAALPFDPNEVDPDPHAIMRLQAICERISPKLRADRIVARQACFRPVTQDGLPLIGKVPRSEGAYVATGHNVWGVLNAPATGEAVAELIADGAAHSTNLSAFDPARLRPLDPAALREG